MATRVMVAVLRPASGGFGEWDWAEASLVEEALSVEMYIEFAQDNEPQGYALDDLGEEQMAALGIENVSGRVRNQRGTIIAYRHEDASVTYEMAWEERGE